MLKGHDREKKVCLVKSKGIPEGKKVRRSESRQKPAGPSAFI